jgi:hypothetical protein
VRATAVATAKNQKSCIEETTFFPVLGFSVGVGFIIQTVPVRFQRVYQVAEMPKFMTAAHAVTEPAIWVSTSL